MNLGTTTDQLAALPKKELFIYPCAMPEPLEKERANRGAKPVPVTFSHRMTRQEPIKTTGGTVRISDSSVFPVTTISASLVEIQPGGLRELHWHTISGDEWQYYLSGFGRMTGSVSGSAARTFNYQGGDVGYVPSTTPHYIQNLGTEPLRYLEVFKSPSYTDVSLRQWLALTRRTSCRVTSTSRRNCSRACRQRSRRCCRIETCREAIVDVDDARRRRSHFARRSRPSCQRIALYSFVGGSAVSMPW